MSSTRNPARTNGKTWKRLPGVPLKQFTGRTIGGYSDAALARRDIRRRTAREKREVS